MEPLDFGKFVVQALVVSWETIRPFIVCEKGQAVIKKRCGFPIKWRNQPRWYWKWPFIDMFDTVDIRKKYIQFNAHSFHGKNMDKSLIPYNIIIDFQVEYQVVNPLAIYDEYGFAQGESAEQSYINNVVQNEISKIINKYGIDVDYSNVDEHFKGVSEKLSRRILTIEEVREYDDFFRKKKRKSNEIKVENCISINDIVITSFDKNISLRLTV